MTNRDFYLVDVFAESRFTGNQLAVFLNGKAYSDSQMQTLAKEMNFSETTFVLSGESRNGGYDVRIFTPEEEVPFAGHPTLGTAFILQQMVLQDKVDSIELNLKVGKIPVRFQYRDDRPEYLWMQQIPPQFGARFKPDEIAAVLNLDSGDLDARFPIQEVSTGLPFIIVALTGIEAVKKARVELPMLSRLTQSRDAKSILVFSPETYRSENDLNVRVFTDYYGIPEDPATGSANGCLAGYLAEYNYFGASPVDIRVEQGYEIGRPSLLLLKAEKNDGGQIQVHVGGRVFTVAHGTLAG